MEIREIYIGGSFCTDIVYPGDIDAYFVLDFEEKNKQKAVDQIYELTEKLNSKLTESIWNWWDRHPNNKGELKTSIWHKYNVDIFPHCYGMYTGVINDIGVNMKFDELFRQDEEGIMKGVIKLVRG
jgi:hypothetical protein